MANGVSVLNPSLGLQAFQEQADQAIVAQGLSQGQPQRRQRAPSLFDQTQAGLFSTGNLLAAAELSEKLTGPFAGGIFGKKAARATTEFFRDQQEAGRSALLQQQESIGLAMTPQRVEIMDQFIDSPLGLAGAAQFLAQEQQQEQFELPLAVAGRQAAERSQAVTRAQAETNLTQSRQDLLKSEREFELSQQPAALRLAVAEQDKAQMEATGGFFGSFLSFNEFDDLKNRVAGFNDAIGIVTDIAAKVEAFTPGQLFFAEGGRAKAELETDIFGLVAPLQRLREDKESTLRIGEAELIEEFVGNPASFFEGIITRDAVIIGKMKRLEEMFQRRLDVSLSGLDQRTLDRLNVSQQRRIGRFTEREGGVTTDPQGEPLQLGGGFKQAGAGLGVIAGGLGEIGQLLQPGLRGMRERQQEIEAGRL